MHSPHRPVVTGSIAFFDLDRTVISRNSATLWIRHEMRARRLGVGRAVRALGWVVRYNLGAADLGGPIREAVRSLAGEEEAVVRARTERFWETSLRDLVRPGARTALERHRTEGDRVVLLTSVSSYLAQAATSELGLDDWVANRFEVTDDGRYTGNLIEPICFGPGKVALAERYLAAYGGRLADTYFYSDSHSDLPMLEAVGHPVVVHPDPQLRREALRRGWPMVDWTAP